MLAYELREYSGPVGLRITELPHPAADGDHAVVQVHAIGINFPDLLITQGLYQLKPDLPFTPGCEIAGTVHAAPPATGWRVGQRVAAFIWQGAYAEFARVPISHLVPIPDAMDFTAAASLLVNHQTAYFGLSRRGNLQAGETALIMGAGGGIGSAGVQVAKGLGAHVIAGVANDGQIPTARAAGADDIVLLREGFSADIIALTGGRGANLALDPLGGWLFTEATRALAPEGRVLIVGFAAGDIPVIKANRLLLKNLSAVGVAWGACMDSDPQVLTQGAAALHEMFTAGTVRPLVGRTFAFEDIPQALVQLSRSEIAGKGVVQVR